MKAEMKLNNKRTLVLTILPDEKTKRKNESLSVDKFFLLWGRIINEAKCVNDFSFRAPNILHVHWFEIKNEKCEESDLEVTLDESILNDMKSYGILENLCSMFEQVRPRALKSFKANLEYHKREERMRETAFEVLKNYSKVWELPSDKDSPQFERAASWIASHKKKVVSSNLLLCTGIEKAIINALRMIEVIIFFGSIYSTVTSSFSIGLDFSPFIIGILVDYVILSFEVNYKNLVNGRTYRDFIDDVDEYNEEKRREFLKSLQEEFVKTEEIVDTAMADLKKYIDENFVFGIEEEFEELASLETNRGPFRNLADRFRFMRELLSLEKRIYFKDMRCGLKPSVAGALNVNTLRERLKYLNITEERMNRDAFLCSISQAIGKILEKPYYGCEADIIAFIEVAVEYYHLCVRYDGILGAVGSPEYRTFLEHRGIVKRRATYNQEGAIKHSSLVSARDTLNQEYADIMARSARLAQGISTQEEKKFN